MRHYIQLAEHQHESYSFTTPSPPAYTHTPLIQFREELPEGRRHCPLAGYPLPTDGGHAPLPGRAVPRSRRPPVGPAGAHGAGGRVAGPAPGAAAAAGLAGVVAGAPAE